MQRLSATYITSAPYSPCYRQGALVRPQTSGNLLSVATRPLARPSRPLGLLVRLSPVAARWTGLAPLCLAASPPIGPLCALWRAFLAGRQTSDAL